MRHWTLTIAFISLILSSCITPFSLNPDVSSQTKKHDTLTVKIQLPSSSFRTQSTYLERIKYIRLWVMGTGITEQIWNQEGYVSVTDINQLRLSVGSVPKGNNRIVTAQAYDTNKIPISGARVKGYYSSPHQGNKVTVLLTWRYVPVGQAVENLLQMGSSLANTLSLTQLQSVLDPVIYGTNPVDGNTYLIHPNQINATTIALDLLNSGGALNNLPLNNLAIYQSLAGTANNLVAGDKITFIYQDLLPLQANITAALATEAFVINNTTPGNWDLEVTQSTATSITTYTQPAVPANKQDVSLSLARINSFAPTFGGGGTALTVSGLGFTGTTAVTINGVTAVFNVDNDGQMTVTIPNNAGTGPIILETPKGKVTSKQHFIYRQWTFATGNIVRSVPAIAPDGTLYIGSYDSKLYAINPNGTLKWNYPVGNVVDTSPAIGSDGTIYFGSHDHFLYALNPNGTLKWNFDAGNIIRSSPAIGADGTIYVGSWDNRLYAINPNGTLKWNYLTGGQVHSSPAIGADGTIYVGSNDTKMHAINPDGTPKWTFTSGNNFNTSSPAIGTDGTIYAGSHDNKVYAINPDGTKKWEFVTGNLIYSSPAIGTDGTIYIGSNDNKLYALNLDGSLKWSYLTGDQVLSCPAIGADGIIYFGSEDDFLYALNPDGSLQWKYQTGGNIHTSGPAIGADGMLYVGSYDTKLSAFSGTSSGLASSAWPRFHKNNQSQGQF